QDGPAMLVQAPQHLAGCPRHGLGVPIAHILDGGDVADLGRVEVFHHRSASRLAARPCVGADHTLFGRYEKARGAPAPEGMEGGGADRSSSIRARASSAKNVSR